MNGLSRLTYAAAGTLLRWLAVVPIGCGDLLLKGSAECERRARPPVHDDARASR